MPRNASGVYSLPSGSVITNGDQSDASDVNAPLADIVDDLNTARPIPVGGTGATSADGARTNLGLAIGTNVQAYDANLTALAALGTGANKGLYATGIDAFGEYDLTEFARTLLDDSAAPEARATLGIGVLAQSEWNAGTNQSESTISPEKLQGAVINATGDLRATFKWVDVYDDRDVDTDIQNTSPFEIQVLIDVLSDGKRNFEISNDGANWLLLGNIDTASFVVPPGHYYRVTAGNKSGISNWKELQGTALLGGGGVAGSGYSLPSYTRAEAEAANVNAVITRILVDGLVFVADGSGTALTTGDARTWSPDGNSTLAHWGADTTGATDVATEIAAAITWTVAQGKALHIGAGTYLVSRTDISGLDNTAVLCDPAANFVGEASFEDFIATAGQTDFVVTAFDWVDEGVVVGRIDDTLQTHAKDEDFSTSSQTVTLTTPATAGERIRIASTGYIIRLRGATGADLYTKNALWVGGRFDNSATGYVQSGGSGGGINFSFYGQATVRDAHFSAGDTVYGAEADKRGDTAIACLQVKKMTVESCYAEGYNDLGGYFTGGSDEGSAADDGTDLLVSGFKTYRCNAGMKAVRQWRRATIQIFAEECRTGVLCGETGDIGPNYEHVIAGSHFRRMGRRAIDYRDFKGVIIQNNTIVDFGTDGAGAATSDAAGIFLASCPGARVLGNTMLFRDDTPVAGDAWVQVSGEGNYGLTVSNNYAEGGEYFLRETGATTNDVGCIYRDNTTKDVTTPLSISSNAEWSLMALTETGGAVTSSYTTS